MLAAPLPSNEAERLSVLQSYEILDTASERSFDELTALAARLTHSPIALVSLVDADRQWFKSRVGLDASETPRDQAFCAHAILGDRMFEVTDAAGDARFADNPLVTGGPQIRHYAGVPLLSPEGMPLGTLCVIDRVPRTLTEDEREILTVLARAVMTTLDLHRALKQTTALALTDVLTGLCNRAALLEALEREIARLRRHGVPFALLYIDLDGFKAVNDHLGHAAGDAVLRDVAQTLRRLARREDVLARIGGDEFTVLLAGCAAADVATIAERHRAAISDAMVQSGLTVTASLGVAAFSEAPDSADSAFAVADRAMYAAKAVGKNRVVVECVAASPEPQCAPPPPVGRGLASSSVSGMAAKKLAAISNSTSL